MRVALFFDGKNHMKDLRRAAKDRWLNHGQLAEWVVDEVDGDELFAAYYYTGVPTPHDDHSDRHALTDLLDELEKRPGFFVKRFNRRATQRDCPHCNQAIHYTEEKMVDTTLVADMILLAVRDAYDIAVVFSGDLDIAPAMEAIQGLGKKAWIATFGSSGLSRTLTRSAWGTLNLLEHIDEFSYGDLAEDGPVLPAPVATRDVDQEMHRELRRAEAHFQSGGGFVGAHYFIHRWKGHNIPDAPELRRQSLQRLLSQGRVQTYQVEGKTALRTIDDAVDFGMGDDRNVGSLDEEELGPFSSDEELSVASPEPEAVVRRIARKK
ncbi:MAG: NYN domain-containing protein [Myxococcota bacterium]